MILRKYGVELVSITKIDLETIRVWRNDPAVSTRMFFQKNISTEKQQNWFNSLTNSDVYMMICYDNIQIGLIDVKNIDFENLTGEAGIFIGDKDYRQSYVPMLAILCMMHTFFLDFGFISLSAILRSDNKMALKFNLDLGYEIVSKSSDQINLKVSREAFLNYIDINQSTYACFENDELDHSLSSIEETLFRLK